MSKKRKQRLPWSNLAARAAWNNSGISNIEQGTQKTVASLDQIQPRQRQKSKLRNVKVKVSRHGDSPLLNSEFLVHLFCGSKYFYGGKK
jgi:ribosomal 30S subunit maturation factor RimM